MGWMDVGWGRHTGGVARSSLNIRAATRHPVVSRAALNRRLQAVIPAG
jgi:hypothetical protein